ncbi:MAG: M48 family metalloprotease, partial [Terracidiphilus sp.]
YWIRIDRKTNVKLAPSLPSLPDVKPGDWIDYKGTLGADGMITASLVKIGPSIITPSEQKLRDKYEFDPSAKPPSDTKKNAVEHVLIGGFDRAEFPPYNDPAMQARVNTIGNELIPAFERALPDSDPSKIHFRFQVVDSARLRDAWTLPNGIILIPRQVIERMQNDAQLATVLADNIACALERQQYRTQTKAKLAAAESWGGLAYVAASSSVLIPVAGDFIAIEGMEAQSETVTYGLQQSGRVSLELLHDAGYDIDQAPIAWWLLAAKRPNSAAEVAPPPRAGYLYNVLGETWHNPAAAAPQGP